jgi:hypothetical protein
VHPAERWAVCKDSEGSPFALTDPRRRAGPSPSRPSRMTTLPLWPPNDPTTSCASAPPGSPELYRRLPRAARPGGHPPVARRARPGEARRPAQPAWASRGAAPPCRRRRPRLAPRLAVSARVVITTVGPYVKYGDPLVATRAEAGTDYVDLTGEPEFVDRTYVVDHARALESGARIVHACGFDSIPHDLGAYFTVKQLPDRGAGPPRGLRSHRRQALRRHFFSPRSRGSRGSGRRRRRAASGASSSRARTLAGCGPSRGGPAMRAPSTPGAAAADDRRPGHPPLRPRPRALWPRLLLWPLRGREAPAGRGRHGRRGGRPIRARPAPAHADLGGRQRLEYFVTLGLAGGAPCC